MYDDLKLSNKGKMKKAKAKFHHRKAGDSSGKKFNLALTVRVSRSKPQPYRGVQLEQFQIDTSGNNRTVSLNMLGNK